MLATTLRQRESCDRVILENGVLGHGRVYALDFFKYGLNLFIMSDPIRPPGSVSVRTDRVDDPTRRRKRTIVCFDIRLDAFAAQI